MKLRAFAVAASALVIAAAPVLAEAADRAGRGGHHHHKPRVSIGVGVGFGFGGGMWDPFYDPFWDYGYPASPAYGYAPQPAGEPCTQAELNKVPTLDINSPDYQYDRIDLARCQAQAAAAARQAAAPQGAATPPAGQPGNYYFCRSTNAFYPHVSQCAEGWQQVAPKPPGT